MDKRFVWLISTAVVIVSFLLINKHFGKNEFVTLKIGNTTIQVELVDTPEEGVRGLSGRKGLAEDRGMLFVFDSSSTTSESEVVLGKPGYHGIWMKGMKFPIDIIWARPVRSLARANGASPEDLGGATSNGADYLEIVDIAENISPDTYPKVFRPKAPASYVLEVNAGFVKKRGIKIDDIFELK